MVLDSKAMAWASEQALDTAALKKAKIPIYGKWYFPDLPAGVPLVNLQTGEVETFDAGFRAGAVLYAREEDLKRAKLGPYKAPPAAEPPESGPAAAEAAPPETTARPAVPPTPERPAEAAAPSAGPRPAEAAVPAEAVAPGAVPTMPAVGKEQPVDMLPHKGDHEHEGGHATPPHEGHDLTPIETHESPHPGPRTYVVIAAILFVITGIEVALYYVPNIPPLVQTVLLLGLSAFKFYMVVAFFMHLKFDHKSFTGYFGGGLAIASSMVIALILLFIANPYGGGH